MLGGDSGELNFVNIILLFHYHLSLGKDSALYCKKAFSTGEQKVLKYITAIFSYTNINTFV